MRKQYSVIVSLYSSFAIIPAPTYVLFRKLIVGGGNASITEINESFIFSLDVTYYPLNLDKSLPVLQYGDT